MEWGSREGRQRVGWLLGCARKQTSVDCVFPRGLLCRRAPAWSRDARGLPFPTVPPSGQAARLSVSGVFFIEGAE